MLDQLPVETTQEPHKSTQFDLPTPQAKNLKCRTDKNFGSILSEDTDENTAASNHSTRNSVHFLTSDPASQGTFDSFKERASISHPSLFYDNLLGERLESVTRRSQKAMTEKYSPKSTIFESLSQLDCDGSFIGSLFDVSESCHLVLEKQLKQLEELWNHSHEDERTAKQLFEEIYSSLEKAVRENTQNKNMTKALQKECHGYKTENLKLTLENQGLSKKNLDYENQIQQLNTKISAMKMELESMKGYLAESEKNMGEMKKSKEAVEEQLDKAKQKEVSLLKTINKMFSEQKGLERNREQILNENVEVLGQIHTMKIKMETTQIQIADAERENSLLTKMNSEIKDDIVNLTDANLTIEKELFDFCPNEHERELKKKLEETKARQMKLANSENMRKKLELECQKNIKAMQNKVQMLAEELREKERKIIEIEGLRQEEYLCLKYEESTLKGKDQKSKSTPGAAEKSRLERAAKYEAEKQRLVQSYQKIHAELQETAKKIECFLRSLNTATEKRLNKTIEDLRAEVTKTVQLKKLFEDARDQLQKDLLALQKEQTIKIQALQEEIYALTGINKELLKEMGVINAEKEAITNLHNETKFKNEQLQASLTSLEHENASMKIEIESFIGQVTMQDSVIKELKQQIEKLVADNMVIEESLKKNAGLLEALNKSCNALEAEKSTFEKKVAELQEQLARLKEEVQIAPVNLDGESRPEEPEEPMDASNREEFLIENSNEFELTQRVAALEKELELLKGQQESYTKMIAELENSKNVLMTENQKLKERLKTKIEEVHNWQLEHDNFRVENLELHKQLKTALNEKISQEKSHQAKLLSLQNTIQEKDAAISKIRAKLNRVSKNNDLLQKKLLETSEKTQKATKCEEKEILKSATQYFDDAGTGGFKKEDSEENESEMSELNMTVFTQQSTNTQEEGLEILPRKPTDSEIQSEDNRGPENEKDVNEEDERDHWKWIAKKKKLKVEVLKLKNEQTIQELNSILEFLSS